jgi:hypothetical protein
MPQVILRLFVLLLLTLCGSGAIAQQALPGLRSMGNDHFDVVGLHLRSVSYVNELSAFSIQIAERYLPTKGLAFPSNILISLRPEANVDFKGDYRIHIAERGSVQVDLLWEDSMTLERTCYAISEALLVQYAIYNYGIEAPNQLRSWTITALANDVYLTLRPAEFADLLKAAQGAEVSGLNEIVEPLRSGLAVPSAAGYWLLQAMKSGSLERPVLRSLFQQAIAGIDIEEALTAALWASQPTAELLPIQTWWEQQLSLILGKQYEVIETMEVSREWLATLGRFDTRLILESQEATVEQKLDLRAIWTHRAKPEVQELVQARYEILRLRMARINPAYYNPALSMGVLFESILNDELAHEYLHSLTIYLSDWVDAKEMQYSLEKILD